MAASDSLRTFRNPALSLWQSAIHTTLLQGAAEGKTTLPAGHHGLGRTADHQRMRESVAAIENLERRKAQPVPPTGAHALATDAAAAPAVFDCAKVAAEIAWNLLFDRAKVPALKNELKFNTCDPFWTECLAEYERYLAHDQPQPYTRYNQLSDFVLTSLPDNATVAILSDWGTGMNDALALLQQIAQFQPAVLIHLGDIYYSGLPNEDQSNFLALIEAVWSANSPEPRPQVYTLSGNHDRYAGAAGGLFRLFAQLSQPSSYFALRNNFWQLLALDTGLHDDDPVTVNSNLTYLEPTEVAWHLDKIRNSGDGVDAQINPQQARGTVLLSHHQLLSFTGVGEDEAGNPLAVNPKLLEAFAPVLESVNLWLWGHEHDLCLFQPYAVSATETLAAGRCIGAGAVPMFLPLPTAPTNLVYPGQNPPEVVKGTRLGNNGTVLNHSYAIATFAGRQLTMAYYQFDSTDATPGNVPPAPPPTYTESFPKQ